MTAADRFAFGSNWERLVQRIDDRQVELAERSLTELVGTVAGKSFVDVGSGSGLFSLAAHRLGAVRVHSFDYDADSVACTAAVKQRYAPHASSWTVERGDILQSNYVAALGHFDVVYSWGVLHHTGQMWDAIRAAASLVTPDGTFAISIYNRVEGRFLSSARWTRIKHAYNRAPSPGRRAFELWYLAWFLAVNRRHPIRAVRQYDGQGRGMSLAVDIADWLGGYPYEYATATELGRFLRALGFECVLARPRNARDTGCNEAVFRRGSAPPETPHAAAGQD